MKTAIVILAIIASAAVAYSFRNKVTPEKKAAMIASTPKSFYDLSYTDINGKSVSMADYKGKYVLCVNVASKCGHTPQYTKLEALYEKHKDKLVIIGFPCNQFLGQEPGSESEIQEFCTKNYGVTFPLASKLDVKGNNQHPVYTWLMNKDANGVSDDKVEWNFHKVLISPTGEWLKAFSAGSDPMEVEASIK
ncbi:MAG: glutathione peroxidase [Flavobacteriales bacterium]|jgi:glutathione peroxidase